VKKVESFNFNSGENLYDSYEIVELLGDGWEGEVYLVKEKSTGIERAAKFFFPHRNKGGRASKYYARKLHKLRNCDIIIQYYSQNTLYWEDQHITYLISEFIDGELLSEYLGRQPGKRMQPFAALHLLHSLARGMEKVHNMKEYHGDLHTDNIIVQRAGLGFDLKLLDLYRLGKANGEYIQDDVVDLINVFYEILGGRKNYAKLPKEIKEICCGLKRSLILKKFRTAGKLKDYLENMIWS